MPTIDSVDSIHIQAPAERVFDAVFDYPSIGAWFPSYRCRLLTPGSIEAGSRIAHTVRAPMVRVPTRFVRTIRRFERPRRIEETYDEGDLLGTGVWTFAESHDGWTTASFHCVVESNRLLMHVGFMLGGELGHKLTYRGLLAALKLHCES